MAGQRVVEMPPDHQRTLRPVPSSVDPACSAGTASGPGMALKAVLRPFDHHTQTRRQRREAQAAEAQAQSGTESRTQRHLRRRSRQTWPGGRAHPDVLTVAIRGPLAAKMRELAETTGMSLAKLLGDMVLAYEGEMNAGTSRAHHSRDEPLTRASGTSTPDRVFVRGSLKPPALGGNGRPRASMPDSTGTATGVHRVANTQRQMQ